MASHEARLTLQVRDALLQLGWNPLPAHFLAILLVQGQSSASAIQRSTRCTRVSVARVARILQGQGIVESFKVPRNGAGRRASVYRLLDARAFHQGLVAQARSTLQVLQGIRRL